MVKKIPLHFSIFIGMSLGLLFGYFFPQQVPYDAPLGNTFIQLLKMVVIPLIFVSVADGIAQVGSAQKLSSLGLKTTVFYAATNALAVLTALILVNLIKPGEGVKAFGNSSVSAPSVGALLSFVPSNLFQALSEGNCLQIIFAAIIFGIGLVMVNGRAPNLLKILNETNLLLLEITRMIIQLAPFGVFGLMAGMVHALDWQVFIGVGKFAATILIALLIHGAVTLPLFFKLFSPRPFFPFLMNMQSALLSAFSTSSSSATLPITMACVEKEGISKEISRFILPVGATVNMDGTAIYEASACLFVAQALGIPLSLFQQVVVFFTAALAAVGAASVPSAGLVTLAMVLSSVGLPLDGIGFLLAIDRPLDMSRTVVNVWGDMVACAVVEGKNKNFSKK